MFDKKLKYGYPLGVWKNFNDLQGEQWADVEGYEGRFRVSDYGRIKSLERIVNKGQNNGTIGLARKLPKIRMAAPNKRGYHRLNLLTFEKRKTYYISRLVAYYFIEKRDGFEVNHKDGNKNNNHYLNLEWVTSSENKIHAIKNGLRKIRRVNQIDIQSLKVLKTFDNIRDVSIFLNVSYSWAVTLISQKKMYNGYLWSYK